MLSMLLLSSLIFQSGAVHVDVFAPDASTATTVAGTPPSSDVSHPNFRGSIENVTAAVGREAVLTCTVNDLGHYKVGWMKADDQTILSLHTRVITHNPRITVTHEDNFRTWQLRIRQLKESDRGCYMCQINTNSMRKQFGCVDVQVPPDIDDTETSGDVTVSEGDNVTLACKAKGHPLPRILWRKENGEHLQIHYHRQHEIEKVDTFSGPHLGLSRVDRRQMGAYLCIASNDVPPAVSKRIVLHVNFAPVIKVPNQLVGTPLNKEVQLECYVEAYPNTINYWTKNREMLMNGKKHSITEERQGYKAYMTLVIRNVLRRDIGTYTCTATNSLGKINGTIRLYEIKVQTKTPMTTTAAPRRITTEEIAVPPTTTTASTRSQITASTTPTEATILTIEEPYTNYLPSVEPAPLETMLTGHSTTLRKRHTWTFCFVLLTVIVLNNNYR